MSKHSAQTPGGIHVLHNWAFADKAARLAATGFVAGDVGKWALQEDEGSLWRLENHDPITWCPLSAGLRYSAKSEEASSTTDTDWQEKVSLSIPDTLPPGSYVVHYSAEVAISGAGSGNCAVQVEAGGTEFGGRETDNRYQTTFAGCFPVQLTEPQAPFSIDMNFHAGTGTTAWIQRARLLLEWPG